MAGEVLRGFHEHRPWSMPTEGMRRAALDRFDSPNRWPSWMLDAVRTREPAGGNRCLGGDRAAGSGRAIHPVTRTLAGWPGRHRVAAPVRLPVLSRLLG